jgi:hypothetical protein
LRVTSRGLGDVYKRQAKWTRHVLPNYFQTVKGDYKDARLSKGDGC